MGVLASCASGSFRNPARTPIDEPYPGGVRSGRNDTEAPFEDAYTPTYCGPIHELRQPRFETPAALVDAIYRVKSNRLENPNRDVPGHEKYDALQLRLFPVSFSGNSIQFKVWSQPTACVPDGRGAHKWVVYRPEQKDKLAVVFYTGGVVEHEKVLYFDYQIKDYLRSANVSIPMDKVLSNKELRELRAKPGSSLSVYLRVYHAPHEDNRDLYRTERYWAGPNFVAIYTCPGKDPNWCIPRDGPWVMTEEMIQNAPEVNTNRRDQASPLYGVSGSDNDYLAFGGHKGLVVDVSFKNGALSVRPRGIQQNLPPQGN